MEAKASTIPPIDAWAKSRYGFYVDRHYQAGKWDLTPGPIRLAEYHADILRHCFTPTDDGRLPYDVIAWCEPAKSGKSAIAGLVAKYAALHLDTNSQVIMASNKRDQAASLMFRSLTDSVDLNPHLPNVDAGKYEVRFKNGNTVKAIPSNSKGEAGARFSLALFDELWGYVHTDAGRLWSEFKTDPTRLYSVKLAIGYAGYTGESELWEQVLNTGLKGQPVPDLAHITNGSDPACYANGRHFTFWSHVTRQPWQTDEWIESQRKALRPPEYARMILCQFAEGAGDFVDQDAWEALIDPDHHPLPPYSDHQLFVGLDVATAPGGDDCACIGVYHEDDHVKVAWHHVWKGKDRRERLKLSETVQPFLERQAAQYRIQGVYFDPWQSQKLADDLWAAGIICNEVQQTHSSRGAKDTALYELVSNRQLVLYDHPDLRRAASGAHAKELGNGLLFLQKAGGRAKIDLLVALSNCANEATQPEGVFFQWL
jgi:phage terminase large subunit-like protein